MNNSSASDNGNFKVRRPVVVDPVTTVQPEVKLHQACSPRELTGPPTNPSFLCISSDVLQGRLKSTTAAARPDEDEERLPQGYQDQVCPAP